MTLWFVLALMAAMTAAAMLAIVWPLTRKGRTVVQSGSHLAFYRDQCEENKRDHTAGRIGDSEAEAARVEVSRRLLAAADVEAATPQPTPVPPARRAAIATAALFVVSFGA